MRKATSFLLPLLLVVATAQGQEVTTEYVFSPTGTDINEPFAVGLQNGARGLSGPWDLDGDGLIEVLVAQHNGAGGRVHVIENQGVDEWEYVYSTAVVDESASSNNARYATGADLDGDGNMEIVYLAGAGYSGEDAALVQGVYIWEHDGVEGSDNYGDRPASIINYYTQDGIEPAAAYAQKLQAIDVDGDGQQELLLPSNGPSPQDIFYVLSVSGEFETNGAGTGFETWQVEARIGPREEANAFGGGSPNELVAADLDGDGMLEISLHSWNNFVLFNAEVTGPDSYVFPEVTAENRFINGFREGEDDVALFGAAVADIDGDGNEEVFYPNFMTGNIGVLDYDEGDDILQITTEKFAFDAIPIGGAGGVATGDIDGDGRIELIVGGSGYSGTSYTEGLPSEYIRIAEFQGGDPKDGANYDVLVLNTSSPIDTTGFNVVYRTDDQGEVTKYYETALSKQGSGTTSDNDPIFPSGIAYLGDADGDGNVEIAVSFQGVDDSLAVIQEVWNPTTQMYERPEDQTEIVEAPVRAFVRIFELPSNLVVHTEEKERDVPSGYMLEGNYPNPFNPSTSFHFTLPAETRVSVKVYDVMGRLVRTLVDGQSYPQGRHQATWNGRTDAGAQAASGTYFYTLEFDGQRISRPMLLIK